MRELLSQHIITFSSLPTFHFTTQDKMALEAIVFPQDHFSYGCKDLYSMGAEWSYNFGLSEEEEAKTLFYNRDSTHLQLVQEQHCTAEEDISSAKQAPSSTTTPRKKRRRTKNCKNKEEVENQRMTHIAVERNRRKQMNEYLAVLRSLMPESYVQRGDQASIIGGAINFVKELEQLLQTLEGEKRLQQRPPEADDFTTPLANFITYPQFSSCSGQSTTTTTGEIPSTIADIEVNMVESHANLKILTPRKPKQLLKIVAAFQNLCLTILHLNVATVDDKVLYSFNVKVEEECQLTSVDEIATAVYQMVGRIQEDISLS